MKLNRNIGTEWAKFLSIVWEKELFYREVVRFLINDLSGNVFQTSRVIGLKTLLSYFGAKKYLNSWKRYFLV